MQTIKLWDLPLRLFHWLLVAAVVALFVSGKVGGNAIEWHGRIGLFVVGLVVFRLVWGFVGSTYARFGQFFPTPARLKVYLQGRWQGIGHNPLGGLSVFVLLGLVGAQAVLGLFTNDDIAFRGPLYDLVDGDLSGQLTGLHHLLANGLILFVVLHVGAVIFHRRIKGDDLVKPMITGRKTVAAGESARGGGLGALLLALAIAGLAVWGAAGCWLPEPPPPPPASTPAW